MMLKRLPILIAVWTVLLSPLSSFSEPDSLYYSDRFIFRGKEIDNLFLVVMNFSRGREEEKYYGEFFGAIFAHNDWSFLEGNDKYFYKPGDLQTIQPSYFAKVEGSRTTGFKLRYDGGDHTITVASGPVQPLYTSDAGETIRREIGVAEAVLTFKGKEYWGELVHEPVVWSGFNGLKRYKGLYKEYQAFYLTTEKGREIYLHRNGADRRAFLERYHFPETLVPEGGLIRSGPQTLYSFKPPISLRLLNSIHPPFAIYALPQRWKVDAPSLGTLYIWSRKNASKNWVWGGYYLMAIEGVFKTGGGEERAWGVAEYIP